jgi:phosphatidylglycerophosphate synthase
MKIWGIVVDWKKIGGSIYNNIANSISILRIACSSIVAVMMVCAFYQFLVHGRIIWPKNYSDFVFNLYVICLASDAVDGFLARILGITSRWGALLDRAGDKILILPIFALMVFYYLALAFQLDTLLAFPIVGLLLGSIYLELMLVRYGFRGFKSNAPVDSNRRGKAKMVMQCLQSSYWMLGFLSPDTFLNFYWIKVSVNPLAVNNLIFTLALLSTIIGLTAGSIAGYKSLPEYRKMLGENNG